MPLDGLPGGERGLPMCVNCEGLILGEPVMLVNPQEPHAGEHLYCATCAGPIQAVFQAMRLLSWRPN